MRIGYFFFLHDISLSFLYVRPKSLFHSFHTGLWSGDLSHHPWLWDHHRHLQGPHRPGSQHRGGLRHPAGRRQKKYEKRTEVCLCCFCTLLNSYSNVRRIQLPIQDTQTIRTVNLQWFVDVSWLYAVSWHPQCHPLRIFGGGITWVWNSRGSSGM